VQDDLQAMMQDLVGIVRNEKDMLRAIEGIGTLRKRAARVRVGGNRQYNPGWHTALDLPNLLVVSEAITRAAIERKESRGAHFREDTPDKSAEFGRFNLAIRKGSDGSMLVTREPLPATRPDLQKIIEANR
jgi:succinate dehydrogenase / fumarate reductase flavoprotein subunit